jgi:hypothetical protein
MSEIAVFVHTQTRRVSLSVDFHYIPVFENRHLKERATLRSNGGFLRQRFSAGIGFDGGAEKAKASGVGWLDRDRRETIRRDIRLVL